MPMDTPAALQQTLRQGDGLASFDPTLDSAWEDVHAVSRFAVSQSVRFLRLWTLLLLNFTRLAVDPTWLLQFCLNYLAPYKLAHQKED